VTIVIPALISVSAILLITCAILAVLLFKTKREPERFPEVEDAERYLQECKDNAAAVIASATDAEKKKDEAKLEIEKLTKQILKYQAVVGDFNSAADLKIHIESEKAKLKEIRGISDVEKYLSECKEKCAQAIASRSAIEKKKEGINLQIEELKKQILQYQNVIGAFKSAAALKSHLENENKKLEELRTLWGAFQTLAEVNACISRDKGQIAKLSLELEDLGRAIGGAKSASEIAAQIKYNENYLAELRREVESVEEARELQAFGFYRPKYDFGPSAKYARRLEEIRAKQKSLLAADSAARCDTEWVVEGSKTEGKKMVKQQKKLMLRAFNGESDAAVAKAKYNNVVSLENRINRAFDQINKLGETKKVSITRDYYSLKLQELYLSYEYQQKKQEEKEEQQRIREQIQEEEKVAREIEKAIEVSEKSEAIAEQALNKAREELARESGKQTAALQQLIFKLEDQLKEALERKAKAIARAQLTKSGHVYVLSNIGSFGEHVYKIGMTRRLEPLERVTELGDASVPFYFDVHAMIYSENAPELERRLHQRFADRRVNMINLRREFFKVTLAEIQNAVRDCFGEVTFVKQPEAEQYRQTIALMNDIKPFQSNDALPTDLENDELIAKLA
jgi:hypothetical protein